MPGPRQHHGAAAIRLQHRVLRRLGEQGLGSLPQVLPDGPEAQRDRHEAEAEDPRGAAPVPRGGPAGRVRSRGGLLHTIHHRRERRVWHRGVPAGKCILQDLVVQGVHVSPGFWGASDAFRSSARAPAPIEVARFVATICGEFDLRRAAILQIRRAFAQARSGFRQDDYSCSNPTAAVRPPVRRLAVQGARAWMQVEGAGAPPMQGLLQPWSWAARGSPIEQRPRTACGG
mmetsp:Transcript_125604/g.246145  ORF Transcript_125604/g.246145 Transcript_125604/m.246145 type:complete len:230 (-) Transcript_125604:62-751(-)